MRKLVYFLVFFIVFNKSYANLYQARGFEPNNCYEHLTTFQCNNKKTICDMTIFTNSKAAISLQVSNSSLLSNRLNGKELSYFKTKFRVTQSIENKKQWRVRLLSLENIMPYAIKSLQKKEIFLANKINCN